MKSRHKTEKQKEEKISARTTRNTKHEVWEEQTACNGKHRRNERGRKTGTTGGDTQSKQVLFIPTRTNASKAIKYPNYHHHYFFTWRGNRLSKRNVSLRAPLKTCLHVQRGGSERAWQSSVIQSFCFVLGKRKCGSWFLVFVDFFFHDFHVRVSCF